MSIADIARSTGIHRHTVRTHLSEKSEDIVANEVRKQVLTQALVDHFKELKQFSQVEFKAHFDASRSERVLLKGIGKERGPWPIDTHGLLGLPLKGSPGYMTVEWQRMYQFSTREHHLIKSLREHTKDSTMWVHYDAWKKKLSAYESASRALWDWVEKELEQLSFTGTHREMIESVRSIAFGGILFTAWGEDLAEPRAPQVTKIEDFVKELKKPRVTPTVKAAIDLLGKVEKKPEWPDLKVATQQLLVAECQNELKHIVKQLDNALASIELMHAFPGHCGLCPV